MDNRCRWIEKGFGTLIIHLKRNTMYLSPFSASRIPEKKCTTIRAQTQKCGQTNQQQSSGFMDDENINW